jgi:hypothetical protein
MNFVETVVAVLIGVAAYQALKYAVLKYIVNKK